MVKCYDYKYFINYKLFGSEWVTFLPKKGAGHVELYPSLVILENSEG